MNTIKKIIIFTFLILTIIGINTKVNAASASITSNKTTMKVGETATITVSVDAAAWNVKVSGAASLNEADSSSDGENTRKTFTTTFKATKAGNYDVNLSGDVTDGATMKPQNISGSVKIQVTEETNNANNNTNNNNSNNNTKKEENKLSSDATLKNLGITPNDFSGFKKTKTSYDVTVPNSTQKINIYAKATDSKATVTGTGSKTLKIGSNSFSVKVTAEDKKTTKTYTLNITRKEDETEEKTTETTSETSTEKTKAALGIYKLSLVGISADDKEEELELNKEFERERLEYICDVPNDVKKVTVKADSYDYNDSIKITGNEEELKEGENIIKVSVSDGKETITYKITVNKGKSETQETTQIQAQEDNQEQKKANILKKAMDSKNIIIGGFIFLVVLEVLILTYLKITKNKKE